MNIDQIAAGDNDLSRFTKFLDAIPHNAIDIIKEDWDNMCGITVSNKFVGSKSDSICFNFYGDGKFRAIIDPSEENKTELYKRSQDREFKYASLWTILKIWWRAKRS